MSPDPHILHVFSSAGLYGAEHMALGLLPALAACGIDGTLVCIDNPHLPVQPLYECALTRGVPAVRVPCAGRFDTATTRGLKRLLAQHPGAILHVHGYKGAFYALRARRAHPGAPIVATLHGWVTNTRALRVYRLLELWMLRRMQCVCIVTDAMRATLRDAGIRDERIRLIENGIDTDRFRPDTPAMPRGELGIPMQAFVFGGVLRLSAEKNPLGLLDAFATVARAAPHAWLVIAGDGPLRGEFERRARAAGIAARVRLLGARDDPERVYPLFNCFVLPSVTEGLPLALLEAMACGRPVIATAVGQVPAVLGGLPARVIPVDDAAALGAAMRASLDARAPIDALRQRVQDRYSVGRMARAYADAYRELGRRDVSQAA